MKTRNIWMCLSVAVAVFAFGGESFARGGGGNGGGGFGGGGGMQVQAQIRSQHQARTNAQTNQVRPEDAQRRDGTFLVTGITANGSTTRPANGKGAMDGSGTVVPSSAAE